MQGGGESLSLSPSLKASMDPKVSVAQRGQENPRRCRVRATQLPSPCPPHYFLLSIRLAAGGLHTP